MQIFGFKYIDLTFKNFPNFRLVILGLALPQKIFPEFLTSNIFSRLLFVGYTYTQRFTMKQSSNIKHSLRQSLREISQRGYMFLRESPEGMGEVVLSEESLLSILRGYLESALWTEQERLKEELGQDEDEDPEDEDDMDDTEKLIRQHAPQSKPLEDMDTDDLDVNSKIQAYKDIKQFMRLAGPLAIKEALEVHDFFQLGMDIWLTRNNHGAGFFDHGYQHEDALMQAAEKLGSVDLYLTDDMQITFSNSY